MAIRRVEQQTREYKWFWRRYKETRKHNKTFKSKETRKRPLKIKKKYTDNNLI